MRSVFGYQDGGVGETIAVLTTENDTFPRKETTSIVPSRRAGTGSP